jgi:hypothetical protein
LITISLPLGWLRFDNQTTGAVSAPELNAESGDRNDRVKKIFAAVDTFGDQLRLRRPSRYPTRVCIEQLGD